jgi:hypothetical protein
MVNLKNLLKVIFFYLNYLPCSLRLQQHSPAQSCASAPKPHVSKYFHDNSITLHHSSYWTGNPQLVMANTVKDRPKIKRPEHVSLTT